MGDRNPFLFWDSVVASEEENTETESSADKKEKLKSKKKVIKY